MSILIWVASDLKELRKAVRNTGGMYSRQRKHPEQGPRRKCVKLWLRQGGLCREEGPREEQEMKPEKCGEQITQHLGP